MEPLTADQRVQLMIGQMVIRNICLEKEVEDLRAKLPPPVEVDPAKVGADGKLQPEPVPLGQDVVDPVVKE